MNNSEHKRALICAVRAARAAGRLMRQNLRARKAVNMATAHDIKLELDMRCQTLIERQLHAVFPGVGFLGEEGISGGRDTRLRWVVDPIDGTVNFAYGIPHACVSIALQQRAGGAVSGGKSGSRITHHTSHIADYETVVGVVYEPFSDELWTAVRGQPSRLNGKVIQVSRRRELGECIIATGFAKSRESLKRGLPCFNWLARRVRKVRIMGSAALSLTYVATGRFDAYIERGVNLWDIAAGGLIIECAGGKFWRDVPPGSRKYRMIASNGLLHRQLPVPR